MFAKSVHHKIKNKPKSQDKQNKKSLLAPRMQFEFILSYMQINSHISLLQTVCSSKMFAGSLLSGLLSCLSSLMKGGLERFSVLKRHFLPELNFLFCDGNIISTIGLLGISDRVVPHYKSLFQSEEYTYCLVTALLCQIHIW